MCSVMSVGVESRSIISQAELSVHLFCLSDAVEMVVLAWKYRPSIELEPAVAPPIA